MLYIIFRNWYSKNYDIQCISDISSKNILWPWKAVISQMLMEFVFSRSNLEDQLWVCSLWPFIMAPGILGVYILLDTVKVEIITHINQYIFKCLTSTQNNQDKHGRTCLKWHLHIPKLCQCSAALFFLFMNSAYNFNLYIKSNCS